MAPDTNRKVLVAGIDEAGRGPLAGPVVAAAVILYTNKPIPGLRDSKLLSPKVRLHLAAEIYAKSIGVGVGFVDADCIDYVNIHQATFLAMAVQDLAMRPSMLLVDGRFRIPMVRIPQKPIVGGDRTIAPISAASIIAKVIRDLMMEWYDDLYPRYGFRRHKGYGTAAHFIAIKRFGPTPIHRKSFAPIAATLA